MSRPSTTPRRPTSPAGFGSPWRSACWRLIGICCIRIGPICRSGSKNTSSIDGSGGSWAGRSSDRCCGISYSAEGSVRGKGRPMSTINGRQQVGHGTGGGFASIDNVAFSRGAWGGWIDDDRAFFANGDDNWIASVYVQSSGAIRRAVLNPANPQYAAGWNSGYAGGGVWAGWLAGTGPQRGLFTSDGWHAPDAGYSPSARRQARSATNRSTNRPARRSVANPTGPHGRLPPDTPMTWTSSAGGKRFGRKGITCAWRVCRSRNRSGARGVRRRITSTGHGG